MPTEASILEYCLAFGLNPAIVVNDPDSVFWYKLWALKTNLERKKKR